jgi:predicted esterase
MITISTKAELAISDRSNFAFSDNGHFGTSLRICNERWVLESWTLISEKPDWRTIPDVVVNQGTNALPLDDGRILLLQRDPSYTSQHCELLLLQHRRCDFSVQQLGEVLAPLGGYLLPSSGSAECGFVVTREDPEHSTIWRVSASPTRIEPIMQVPGLLSRGVWLDRDAGVLALNQTTSEHRCSGIMVDLVQRSWRRIWFISDTSNERIVLSHPASGLLIVTSNAAGAERLGWWLPGDATVHFPEILHRPGYQRQALTLDDHGERVLVHEVQGALSRLCIYTLAEDRLETLDSPPGVVSFPALWTGDLIRFRFSSPCRPPALASLRLGNKPRWSVSRDPAPKSQPRYAQANLIELPGPAGPIEAIIYGGPDWRQCHHLVIALHGGPLSSWRFEFEPLFQCAAAAGVAVVAPNYRGSTGYGEEHLRAVLGSWGGADLEDVLALSRSLENERKARQLPQPVIFGVSYGAFLALLAACHEPELWSACIALAPFLSGPRLHESVDVATRHRIEQLGGLQNSEGEIPPRDVLQVCDSLSVPLLLMHGITDATIPVEQSRMLKRRLIELGRIEDVDFEYLEVDRDHTELIRARSSELNQRVVRFCLDRLQARQNPRRQLPLVAEAMASSHCDGKWNR